ncbi:MAG: flippase [Promethearchaeota archaeon]
MKTLKTFIKNFTSLVLSRIFQQGLHVIFIALLARYLGAEGFGIFAFCLSVVTLFCIFVNFGLNTLLVREIAKYKERASELIGKALFIKITFALVMIAGISVYAYFAHMEKIFFFLLLIISCYSFVDSMTDILNSCFRAYERMELEAFLSMFGSFFYVAGGIAAIWLKVSLIRIVIVLGISYVLKFIFGIMLFFRRFPDCRHFGRNFRFDWPLLKMASVFALVGGIGVIFGHTDKLMLGALCGYGSVGWYAATNKLLMTFFIIPSLFVAAIFPVFSRLHQDAIEKLKIAYVNSFYSLLTLGVIVGIISFMFSDLIIGLMYGKGFDQSILILKVMAFYLIWQFPNYVNGQMMVSINKERLFSMVYGFFTVLNIILNYILIIRFGFMGACYATIFATGLGFVFYTCYIHRHLSIALDYMKLVKLTVSALCLVGILLLALRMGIHFVWSIFVIAPVIYFSLVLIFRIFPRETLLMLFQCFSFSRKGIRA